MSNVLSQYWKPNQSFSGCDMVCSVEMLMPNGSKVVKAIGSLQTLTYSIHQDKRPVRSIGNVNAKDYVLGQRTIAGTLIFAVFSKHWAYDLMDEARKSGDLGQVHFLMDEMPPFNITISAANEYGYSARLAIYGVRIVNEGQVMAVNDVFTENTYQFVATDLDYLTDCTGFKSDTIIQDEKKKSAGPIRTPIPSKDERVKPLPPSSEGESPQHPTIDEDPEYEVKQEDGTIKLSLKT